MTNEQRAILVRAIELVKEGWCQIALRIRDDGKSCFCAFGAIVQAYEENKSARWLDCDRVSTMVQNHYRTLGYPQETYISWNDAPGRTQDEVIALLESVANQS